ncbi:LysR family transcriptional regulator [Denitratisoma sp. DHT3]|uniref:LysR family transcriptional regulator n=1 Tax=Denitratisoma sp. DHT3 TaxID=1981880 RepID=UPI001198314C|nr:LysR family transcriptional regulator [Denitratisoma sp. DHT3]QDX80681.1 LysR family transcriptional regulator [Denitratisoma sp. DHT3]
MDRLTQIEAFVATAGRGSLTAAAQAEGVTPAVIGRRIDALEQRLGVRLMLRTTRRLSLTQEGAAYLEECQRLLNELANAEAAVSLGGVRARGHLRISAPAGFGRRHVAPRVAEYLDANPEVTVGLDLSDRIVDLVNEGIDCAVRVGELVDSSLTSVRLGDMRRMVVASPAYLARHGAPATPDELGRHECLSLGQQRGWSFAEPKQKGSVRTIKVAGRLECNDGAVLHEWALAGRGLAWRSQWEVGEDLKAGRLVAVLEEYAAPPLGIYALYPQRRQMPLRLRLFIDLLRETYRAPGYWEQG